MCIHGLLVVDKPPGPTSYDVIRFLRKTCGINKKWKIGHLGTLDPFASGVMVIAFGQAVKYSEFGLRFRKTYRARLWLGDETDTLDPTGKVIATAPVPDDWKDRLAEVCSKFTGEIQQVPPAFSAKQVDGVRAYKSARAGEPVELKPVKVTIYSLQIIASDMNWVDFVAEVSSGTYVRSLGRDIAHALGTVGHLVGLERMSVGPFDCDMSIPFEAFERGGMDVLKHHLKPVDTILAELPSVVVKAESVDKIIYGKLLGSDDVEGEIGGMEIYRIYDSEGRFRSLGRWAEAGIIPYKPFTSINE